MKRVTAVDLFCGAGGTSTGLARACEAAGRRLDLTAVNHWPTAVETHSANHPAARHLCETLEGVDPRTLYGRGRIDLLIASPECTHHSQARGGKPMNDQSRATAWHVVRWADALRPRAILVENVREFQTWGPLGENGRPLKRRRGEVYEAWLAALRALGYRVEARVLNAADYGDATTRRRLFVLAVRGRGPMPWPSPSHGAVAGANLFGRRKPWRAAREVIDWSLPSASIFGRKRPLSANTLKRIEAGLKKFGGAAAEPFLVMLRGTGKGQVPYTANSIDGPVPTITGAINAYLAQPFTVHTTHGGTHAPKGVDGPLPTVTGANRGEQALVEPFVVNGQATGWHGTRVRKASDPTQAITGNSQLGLCQPFIVPTNYGERPGQSPRTHSINAPHPTVVAGGQTHALVEPFILPHRQFDRMDVDSCGDPLRTITATNGRITVVTEEVARLIAAKNAPQPVSPWDLPTPALAAHEAGDRAYERCGHVVEDCDCDPDEADDDIDEFAMHDQE